MNLQQPEKRDYNIWIGVFVFLAILNLVIALNIKFITRNGYEISIFSRFIFWLLGLLFVCKFLYSKLSAWTKKTENLMLFIYFYGLAMAILSGFLLSVIL